ncbi:PDZ domain-containing protein [Bacillus lacus]|uniref:C-terminal processing peptidase n=1 Tax=Metabacillus lacus TaxID=1983721 RepID=A0A7X2LXT6_9BACI|nr:S41 family peptidase [Metabacillus lacus]MRX72905.1 PDZ domain-containing protein [Metabacillus lacus]
MNNNTLKYIVIIAITAFLTYTVTVNFTQQQPTAAPADHEEFNKLFSTFDTIKRDFYENADDAKLVDGAIKGMIESLDDPYSTYMDKEEAKGFNENISSSFEGIGAEVQENNGTIMIVTPIKGSPAEKAGIRPRDTILKVDDQSVEGMTVNEAVMLIRGEKGSNVTLNIEREGVGNIDVTITRDTIPIETVYSEVIDGNIGKIQITKFSDSTGEELSQALNELSNENVESIILDLRQNPGGLMDEALAMSDLFLEKGSTIMQVENKNGSKEVYQAKQDAAVTLPVVVVVDEGTASAGEIMAAALHESGNIPIVGTKTFGKGTIQTAKVLDDGSSIKYTIAKWLTPAGTWVHQKGIEPQQEAKLPEYANLPFLNPEKAMKQGDSSPEVKTAQQMLKALGYEVTENGVYDEDTQQAVSSFQEANGIQANKEISGQTTLLIMEKLREQIQENDTQIQAAKQLLQETSS